MIFMKNEKNTSRRNFIKNSSLGLGVGIVISRSWKQLRYKRNTGYSHTNRLFASDNFKNFIP